MGAIRLFERFLDFLAVSTDAGIIDAVGGMPVTFAAFLKYFDFRVFSGIGYFPLCVSTRFS